MAADSRADHKPRAIETSSNPAKNSLNIMGKFRSKEHWQNCYGTSLDNYFEIEAFCVLGFLLILLGAFLAFSSLGAGLGKRTQKALGAHQEKILIAIKENTAVSIVQTKLRTVNKVSCIGKFNIIRLFSSIASFHLCHFTHIIHFYLFTMFQETRRI